MALPLHEVFSISDKHVQFIDDETIVFRSGNTIVYLNVISKHKSVVTFDAGQSIDCFTVLVKSHGPSKLIVATHGVRTEISIFNYPETTPCQTIKEKGKLSFGLMSVDHKGERLATISKYGASFLTLWDLEKGEPMLEASVADDYNFMSFNPFNSDQLCCGHAKRVTVWNLITANAYTKPYLRSLEVSIDVSNKIERQVLSHLWIADNKLICSSPTGELLLCDVGKYLEERAQLETAQEVQGNAFMAAQRDSVVKSISTSNAPVGAGGQAQIAAVGAIEGLADRVSDSRQGYPWQSYEEEEKIVMSVIASRLPFAPGDEDADAERLKRGRWGSNKGAVVYGMAVTKQYLVVGTEDGSVLFLSWDNFRVARVLRLRGRDGYSAVCVVNFSSSYKDFVTVGMSGIVHLTRIDTKFSIEDTENDALQTFQLGTYALSFGYRSGVPIGCGACVLPQLSTDFTNGMRLVTYNSNGNISLWAIASKSLICSFNFKAAVTSVSSSPDGLLIAVGLSTGVLAVMDSTSPISLRLVYAVRFHNTAVVKVAFSPEGDMIATMSAERMYFVRPSDFKVLGRVELWPILRTPSERRLRKAAHTTGDEKEAKEKDILDSDEDEDEPDEVEEADDDDEFEPADKVADFIWLGYASEDSKFHRIVLSTRACKAFVIYAPNSYFEDADSAMRVSTSHLQLKASALGNRIISMVRSNREPNVFLGLSDSKKLQKYTVSEDGSCTLDREVAGHAKNGTQIAQSPSGLLASTGEDGNVVVWDLKTLQRTVEIPCHDYRYGGGRSVVFTEDCRHLITTGGEGGIFVWEVSSLEGDTRRAVTYKTALSIREKVLEEMEAIVEPVGDIIMFNPNSYHEADPATIGVGGAGATDVGDSRQKMMREQLLKNIERFKGIFNGVLKKNEEAVEEERLGLLEFAVDVELRDQLIAEGKQRTENVRKEMTAAYESKELVAKRIKEQCWNSMEVRGEMFRAFNSGVEVTNFPIRTTSAAQIKKLKQIQFMRRMQLLQDKAETSTKGKFEPVALTDGADYLLKIGAAEEDGKEPPYVLFHPLQCVTGIRKRIQAILLASKITDLKRGFNKSFKKCYGLKQIEIENIHEKNKRIKEIQEELSVPVEVYEAFISEDEIPDSVLKVKDSEVKSIRVLTKEEQAIYDAKMEAERLKALNRDDAPDRALDDFMGGTLETNREISLLDQHVPREEWMDLEQEEMTDEQKADYTLYLKKVEELNAEKDDRRKLLQTELTKLKNDVADVYKNFDGETRNMLQKRVSTLQDLYQHELMIIRIINDLGKHEKQKEEGIAIQRRLALLRREKKIASARAAEFLSKYDNFGLTYEELVTEERVAEKMFRKEFSDAGEHLDLLLKLFRASKRANQQNAQKKPAKEAAASKPAKGPEKPGERPTSSKAPQDGMSAAAEAAATAMAAVAALTEVEEEVVEEITLSPFEVEGGPEEKEEEEESEMPEDMDPSIWARFIEKKRSYRELEDRVHKTGLKHEDMNRHLISLQSRDKAVAEEIMELGKRYEAVELNRSRLALDTEVMVKTLQGMVEIEEAPVVTDLKDCEMIERRIVEDLNKLIKHSGTEKVGILKEITLSRSAINLLKWTKKKLSLEHKDAVDLTTELQLLRVTKSLQSLIKMGGHDNQKAAELKRLDRKIEFLNHATREKTLGKKLKLMQVKKKIRQQNRENDRLLLTVEELEAAVRERVQISNIRGGGDGDDRKSSERKMKALVTRRKLVDLAKLQAEEIKFLRDQVESLRKRTFASFAVPHIPANPDEVRHENYPDLMRSSKKQPIRPPSSFGKHRMPGGMGGRAVTQ